MEGCKPVSTPLVAHFKLSMEQYAKFDVDVSYMKRVPSASDVGNVMYAVIFTRPDIAHDVSVVSRYKANHGKANWEAEK